MDDRRKEDAPTFAEIQRVLSFLQHARMSKERTALVKNALAVCDAAPKNLQDRFMDDACAVILSPLYAAGFQQPAIASALDAAERCGFAAGRRMGRAEAFAEAQEYCHGYFNYPELTTWLDERERAVLDGAAEKEGK